VRHLDVHEDTAEVSAGSLVCRDGENAVNGRGEGEGLASEVGREQLEVDIVVVYDEEGGDVCGWSKARGTWESTARKLWFQRFGGPRWVVFWLAFNRQIGRGGWRIVGCAKR
jgi:hypothetical protein